jgi:hypothetical protein
MKSLLYDTIAFCKMRRRCSSIFLASTGTRCFFVRVIRKKNNHTRLENDNNDDASYQPWRTVLENTETDEVLTTNNNDLQHYYSGSFKILANAQFTNWRQEQIWRVCTDCLYFFEIHLILLVEV